MVTQESGNSSLCVDATEDDRGSLMSDSNPSLSSSGSVSNKLHFVYYFCMHVSYL